MPNSRTLTTPGTLRKTEKRPALKLATWNVRIMLTGISDDLEIPENFVLLSLYAGFDAVDTV